MPNTSSVKAMTSGLASDVRNKINISCYAEWQAFELHKFTIQSSFLFLPDLVKHSKA